MSCNKTGAIAEVVCTDTCCVSMFGSRRERLGGEVVGFDLRTREVVFPTDHPREYWKAKGPDGDGSLVCLDCLRSTPSSRRVLVYYETEPGRPFFRHRPGESPEGDGVAGETQWHYGVKHRVARWARAQPAVADVAVEWALPSRLRRTDVHVTLRSGREFAVEVQYSPIDAVLHAQRQQDYQQAGVTPIWLYSIDLAEPRWAGDNLTFGIRLGPVDEHGRSVGSRLELGVPFSQPNRVDAWTAARAEDFLEYGHFRSGARKGAMWVQMSAAVLTDAGITVTGDPVEFLRRQGLPAAAAAADRHNAERAQRMRPTRTRSRDRDLDDRAEYARRTAAAVPSSTGFTCEVCGTALAPELRQSGRHVLC